MKYLITLLLAIVSSYPVFSQCEEPVIENWYSTDLTTFTIVFTAPENTESYWIQVSTNYEIDPLITEGEMVEEGTAVSGLNTIEVDISEVLPSSLPIETFASHYFYNVELKTICSSGVESLQEEFYMSRLSKFDDPQVTCEGHYFEPFSPLGGPLFQYDTEITIPPQDTIQGIQDISIHLDIGHAIGATLLIDLISPSGNSIVLYNSSSYPDNLNAGMSVTFSDEFPSISTAEEEIGLTGNYAPAQPLANLYDGPIEGEWIVRFVSLSNFSPGYLFGVCMEFNSTPCNQTISGKTYYDLNSNATQDSNEPGYNEAIIYNSSDDNIYTNGAGEYSTCIDTGTSTLSLSNIPEYFSTDDINVNISEGDELTGLDFPLSPIPGINDLTVQLFNIEPDRPGFDNTYIVQYDNVGTECIDPASIEVNFDESISILGIDDSNATFTDSTAMFNLGEICPTESGQFQIEVNIDDTVSIGSHLISSATISPVEGDETINNNTSEFDSEVVGSFDPNDKQVDVEQFGPQFLSEEKSLKYLVRFQNTGNYYAERVVITDTLSSNLDLNSLEILAHSHPMEMTREGNVVNFEFDEIFLPDSTTDEEGSHGFVRFQVTPNSSISNGTSIDNKAYIFFDFNEPIITNTVSSVFDISLGTNQPTISANVFPNPASNILIAEWPQYSNPSKLDIIDITGKLVKSVAISNASNREEIDVENLKPGMYFLRLDGIDNTKPARWVKH